MAIIKEFLDAWEGSGRADREIFVLAMIGMFSICSFIIDTLIKAFL